MNKIEPIIESVTIHIPQEAAFNHFINDFSQWWPKEYTWSQDALEKIGIETDPPGFCYEIGPHGFRCDWGKVIECNPAGMLAFTWQISHNREPIPDPDKASEVVIRFENNDEEGNTVLKLEHSQFHKHQESSEEYRNALASEYGWPLILNHFKEYAEKQ